MAFLKFLGWLFVPYIMIFVSWKKLKAAGRTFGIIWAFFALMPVIGIFSESEQLPSTSVAQAEVTDVNTDKAKEKADKKAAADAKKKAEVEAKAAAEKEKADKKAAEEVEYNKPENVYERWVQAQFSAWDGSATALKKSVKENMNNPKSFEHVETTYSDKGDMLGIDVYMKFRGTNAFGAIVTQTVHASYDYATGSFTYEVVE